MSIVSIVIEAIMIAVRYFVMHVTCDRVILEIAIPSIVVINISNVSVVSVMHVMEDVYVVVMV